MHAIPGKSLEMFFNFRLGCFAAEDIKCVLSVQPLLEMLSWTKFFRFFSFHYINFSLIDNWPTVVSQ